MKPFFSIIIPTFNRADRLKAAIQSVLNQTNEQFELIIVNDGSTDHTEDVVKSFDDERIVYISKKNGERAVARNTGIEVSKGDYVTFLDSDDEIYAHCLREAQSVIRKYQNPEWLHLAYEIKNGNGQVLRKENRRKGDINSSLITGNHLSCIGVFVRKEIIEDNMFNTDPDLIGSEDYVLWMQLAVKYKLRYSNRICACLKQHSERSVEKFSAEMLVKRINKCIQLIMGLEPPIWNKSKFISHRYSYLSLHALLGGSNKLAATYLIKSIVTFPPIVAHKKTLYIAMRFLR